MKTVVCIIAHPDDEAFGPSGTICKLARKNKVYILCITRGEAGKNSLREQEKLGKIRAQELRASAKILGVRRVYFLGFKDGALCNNLYHKLANKIKKRLEVLRPEIIITFEPRGISGHIDHIVTSFVTTYVVTKLPFVKQLWYHCITEERSKARGRDYFIYFPPGYKRGEIGKIVDVSDVWETKAKAMMAHKSQMHDAEKILKILEKQPKEEYFLIEHLQG